MYFSVNSLFCQLKKRRKLPVIKVMNKLHENSSNLLPSHIQLILREERHYAVLSCARNHLSSHRGTHARSRWPV